MFINVKISIKMNVFRMKGSFGSRDSSFGSTSGEDDSSIIRKPVATIPPNPIRYVKVSKHAFFIMSVK